MDTQLHFSKQAVMVTIIFWVIGVTVLLGLSLYLYFPQFLVKLLYRIHLFRSGLTHHKLRLESRTIAYVERGLPNPTRPSIVFLHGFSSSKEAWAHTIQNLPKDVHAVAFDLPSHGETSYNIPIQDLTLSAFAEHVHQFVRLLGLDKRPFHLVGLSMGGTLCGKYSATYPQNLACATLVCPGMRTPELSTMAKLLADNKKDPLIPQSAEDLQRSLDLTLHKRVTINKQLLKGMLEIRAPRNEHLAKLITTLRSDRVRQEFLDCLPQISVPTQVIWGDNDNLADKSGVSTLKAQLPNLKRVDIIEECGHSINLDHPKRLSNLIFLHNSSVSSK